MSQYGRLTVHAFDPLIKTGGVFYQDLSDQVTSYSHELGADGGYITADIQLAGNTLDIQNWMGQGIGRLIKVYSPSLRLIWEGFVNLVRASSGGVTVSIGPLMEVGNRVSVVYAPIEDATADPPVVGETTETTIAEDTDSQDEYGIIEAVLNAGSCFNDATNGYVADDIRDTFLAENKSPVISTEVTLGGGDVPTITLECRGYAEWFAAYAYNQEVTQLSVQCSSKFEDVVDDDPNSIFSDDHSQITFNGVLTSDFEDENRLASDILQSITALGGASGDRWLWGVGEKRIVYYKAIPTAVEYYYSILEGKLTVGLAPGVHLNPCEVEAGKWLYISDLAWEPTNLGMTNLREDKRAMFVESVRYTYPDGLTLSGSRTETLKQKLAQLGLGGV